MPMRQRKLVRNENANEEIRETYNGEKERKCKEDVSARTVKTKVKAEKKVNMWNWSGALQIFRVKSIYKCGSRVKPHLLIYKRGFSYNRICKSLALIYKCGFTLEPHL